MIHLGIPSARSSHLQALFLMKVLAKMVFPLNQHMCQDNPHHIEAIAPNSKLLQDSLPSNGAMKTSYQILVKAVNEMRI
jgi:hypothetical protein